MKIYYNPKCSTCRKTLAIINDKGIEPKIIEYLDNPLNLNDLQELFAILKLDNALPMVRVKEDEFKEAGLSKENSNDELLDAIAKYPKLLERPIVVTDNGALICRPPEIVGEII